MALMALSAGPIVMNMLSSALYVSGNVVSVWGLETIPVGQLLCCRWALMGIVVLAHAAYTGELRRMHLLGEHGSKGLLLLLSCLRGFDSLLWLSGLNFVSITAANSKSCDRRTLRDTCALCTACAFKLFDTSALCATCAFAHQASCTARRSWRRSVGTSRWAAPRGSRLARSRACSCHSPVWYARAQPLRYGYPLSRWGLGSRWGKGSR
jgi:hypothetical protein